MITFILETYESYLSVPQNENEKVADRSHHQWLPQ